SEARAARSAPETALSGARSSVNKPQTRSVCGLSGQDADDVAHRVARRLQRVALVVGEIELDDLLDPARAELARHAHVEAVDAVLALEVRGAREHALLV